MSDKQKPPPTSWIRASPMHSANPTRLTSPGPGPPRQRSPTPTFNARQFANQSPFIPSPQLQQQQSPVHAQRTGFTTVYDSQRFSQDVPMSPVNFVPSDSPFPRPFHNTFSPTQSVSTRCSSVPTPIHMDHHQQQHSKQMSDFYLVPLEPANLSKNVALMEDDERPSTADIIAQQSQDYVDEKLAEYQMTITLLQGE